MTIAASIGACVRRTWPALVALLACLSPLRPAAAFMPPRYAAILIDARTGEVLYANAADELRHPASITKVMTLYLAFDALVDGRLRLTDPITISAHAAAQRPSKLGLAAGKSIDLDDAIHVITVKSANDLAVAVAERLGGNEQVFAGMMTRKARALGMTNTVFTNASGLSDPGNVTTARDIATLCVSLLRVHPSYYAYFGQQAFSYDNRSFANHNHLLGKMTGLDGIKTGYTVDSGFTLAASAQRDGRRLIAVVLGEPSIGARNRDVTALLDAGFAVLDRRRTGEETTVAANLPTPDNPALRLAAVAGEEGSRVNAVGVGPRAALVAPRYVATYHVVPRHAERSADRRASKSRQKAGSKTAARGKGKKEQSASRDEPRRHKRSAQTRTAPEGKTRTAASSKSRKHQTAAVAHHKSIKSASAEDRKRRRS